MPTRQIRSAAGRRRLKAHQQHVDNLEKDRDALLQSMSETVPSALDDLDGEDKNRLYQMLRLEVTPSEEGYEVSDAFLLLESHHIYILN
jgi:hypothetical protein